MKKIIVLVVLITAIGCKKESTPEKPWWNCVFAVRKTTNQREYVGCEPKGPTHSASISAKLDNFYKGPYETFDTQDSASCKNF